MARSPLLLALFAAAHAAAGVTSIPDSVATPQVNASPGGAVTTAGPAFGGLAAPSLSLSAPALSPFAAPSVAPAPIPSVQPAAAKAAKPAESRRIVFDVRGSRGGHGDVAAAYLTAYDLLDRTVGHKGAVTPEITFVAGATERAILARLAGRPVRDGDDLFDGYAKVYGPDTLPAEHPPADVLMNLAAQEGEFTRHGDLRWADGVSAKDARIPVNERTVILTQTVFGNTESASNGPATALVAGRRLELSHAGLARGDAGIYADPVARSLRGRPREEVRRFVLTETEKTEIGGTAAVAAILHGEVLAGAEVGLAYGISMKEVKPQFERYLAGLAMQAHGEKKSFVIVTPSGFKLEDIKSKRLRDRVIVFDGDRVMPESAEPGRIYVLKTGTLPHPLFVGLMAYSRPPPVVAGDGAMSAAVGLGRPFVLTKVGWNDENIRTFAERLSLRAPEGKRELIKAVYLSSKLERAGELDALAGVFAETSRAIPTLTDTMFAAVQAARDAQSPDVPTDRLLGGVKDPILRASLISLRALLGDADAQEIAFDALRGGDARERRLVASAMFRDMSSRLTFLKPFRALDFHPLNILAAKLALRFTRAASRESNYPQG
jgi:hypothetical protein